MVNIAKLNLRLYPLDSCVRQLINPIIVHKDTTEMTNHMIKLVFHSSTITMMHGPINISISTNRRESRTFHCLRKWRFSGRCCWNVQRRTLSTGKLNATLSTPSGRMAEKMSTPDSSVGIATCTGCTVLGLNPGPGEIFRTRPHRPWSPPSRLLNGYLVFPGVRRPGRGVDHPPNLAPRLKKV